MVTEKSGRLINQIGLILAQDKNDALSGTLLYAAVEHMAVESAIFRLRGHDVAYSDAMDSLTWPLLWLWEEEPADKRWAEMEYLIRDGRFTVTYTYPDEIDPGEDPFVRRDRIVARHFGDKPIVYPSWDDSVGQTFKL